MMAFALTLVACDALLLPTLASRAGHASAAAGHASAAAGHASRAGVSMVERRSNGFEKVAAMPEHLLAWGCDDKLWDALRSKGRKNLKQLLRDGNEELARGRIARMRETVAVELEARRAADYLCHSDKECATELTAKLLSEAAAKTEDANESAAAAVAATTSEAIAKEGETTTTSVDAAAEKAKEVGTAAMETAVPAGFEWGGTF